MPDAPRAELNFAPAAVDVTPLDGGGMVLRSPMKLNPYPRCLGEHLRHWAREAPERTFLAEREPGGAWRRVSYREALGLVERVAQGLLERGVERPLMVLSENGVDNGLLELACQYVGIPVAPVSPAYSLVSEDHGKLRYVFGLVRPGMLYVGRGKPFARALAALDLEGVELVVSSDAPEGLRATPSRT